MSSWKDAFVMAAAIGAGLGPASARGATLEHRLPACIQPGKGVRVRVCVRPHAHARHVRLHYRQGSEGPWRQVAMTSDMPCFVGRLPGVGRGTFSYFFTANVTGSGHLQSATFNGDTRRVDAGCVVVEGTTPAPSAAASERAAAPQTRTPRTPPTASGAPPDRRPAKPPGEGSSKRTWLLLGAAGLVGGGAAAVVATRSGQDTAVSESPVPLSGLWLGTQTVTYSQACGEQSRIALRLTDESGALTGTLSFTVTACTCCALGTGADPIAGSSDATSLRFRTPVNLEYQGQRVRQSLQGSLQGAGGITGTWSVDRQP